MLFLQKRLQLLRPMDSRTVANQLMIANANFMPYSKGHLAAKQLLDEASHTVADVPWSIHPCL